MPTPRPAFTLLSLASNLERHKLASGEPWLLLLNLRYPGSADPNAAQQYVRLVRNPDPIVFDAGDGQGPQTYAPFNFEMGEFNLSTTGVVPEMDLKASNVMRALQATIEQYAGVVGADLNLYVVNQANLAGEPELAVAFTVKQSVCDAKLVTFKLGASSPLRRLFPLFMYRPNFCAWQYKGPQCGYVGPMTSCSKTIEGATGCQAHFPTSPLRGLFFPGIDTNGAAIASVA
ncbi:MAG TPA: hypothetical protein VLI45_09190 [Acidobacteriaceae bacterium]|nr:hypothetical protein [Acidobacteriaceae bacterium]